MSVGPCAEKFNIASNDHGRTQKFDFCICLKSKTLYICRFSPSSSSPRLLWNIGEFGAKEYFADHHTSNTIHGFRDTALVCKMHDCYCRIRKNFEQHSIPSHWSDALDAKKPLQNVFKRIYHYIYLFKLCSISIILLLKNNQHLKRKKWLELNLWMVYTCNMKNSGKYETRRWEEGECTLPYLSRE